jgi:hypothetical protein
MFQITVGTGVAYLVISVLAVNRSELAFRRLVAHVSFVLDTQLEVCQRSHENDLILGHLAHRPSNKRLVELKGAQFIANLVPALKRSRPS